MKRNPKFIVEEPIKLTLLKSASDFIRYLNKDTQKLVYENIHKSGKYIYDHFYDYPHRIIFNYETSIDVGLEYNYVAFWDRREYKNFIVIASHGFSRTGDKIPEYKIEMINMLMNEYFKMND
jgi:hypothetical protein